MIAKITTHSLLFLTAIGLSVLACSKDNECETWEYYDECIPKTSTTFCTGPAMDYRTGKFCDDNLSGISPGSTKTIHEDTNARIVRHFTKKI